MPWYVYVEMVLLGVGAVGVGIHLRRKLRASPPTPPPAGPDPHGRYRVQRIGERVAPYFLMVWGAGMIVGCLSMLMDRL